MRSSKTIEREISELQARRELIADNHAQAHSGLSDARTRMVKGQGSSEEVAAAQSAYAGLDGVLAEADAMLGTLREELRHTREHENSESTKARAAELNAEREQSQTDYHAEQRRLSDLISSSVEKLLEASTRFHAAGREIEQLKGVQMPSARGQLRDLPTEHAETIATAMRLRTHQLDRARRKAAA